VEALVLYNGTLELDEAALLGTVDDEIRKDLRPDELIIVFRNSTAPASLAVLRNATTLATLLSRVGEQCHVRCLCFDERGEVVATHVLQAGSRKSGATLSALVRRGVTDIFTRQRGFVEGSETYHFQNPSGRHTDRFIRLSNILVRQAEISFIALSLLPLIPNPTDQVYIDTPSLYAVISAMNDLRSPKFPPLPADNFRSYFGFDDYAFEDPKRSLAVISASSSGSLAEKLAKRNFTADRIVHLLYLGEETQGRTIAVDLAFDPAANPKGESPARKTYESAEVCPFCKNGSQKIELQGDQFDVSPPQPKPIVVRKPHAGDRLRQTFERLVGAAALETTTGHLHRVNPEQLLKHQPYLDRLTYLIRRHVPGGATFCILADQASQSLGELVAATSRQTLTFVQAQQRGAIQGIGGKPGCDGPILVVASAIGSGRALLDISRELRTAAPNAAIMYLVGFARPDSAERRTILERNLVFSNHHASHAFSVADELILPPADRENAWQRELEFLEQTASDWPATERTFISKRQERLLEAATPLIDDLFVANQPGRILELRPGFAFWPEHLSGSQQQKTQAEVFATVSSVLQGLRTAPLSAPEAIRTGWLRQTLINPEVFGRFNDGVIQASFLRAALPSELDYRNAPDLSREAARLVFKIVEGSSLVRGEGAYEFLLALVTHRLRLRPEHMVQILSIRSVPRRIATMLKLAKQNLGS
jgi:hypothetical protein